MWVSVRNSSEPNKSRWSQALKQLITWNRVLETKNTDDTNISLATSAINSTGELPHNYCLSISSVLSKFATNNSIPTPNVSLTEMNATEI